MIDRTLVDEIVARTDMQTLVGGYVKLKRAGANLNGLCPFHSEKTPSFTVFPSDGSFYCFGCGVGGNAITFVRKIENLEFTEAVAMLARRAGINIPQTALVSGGPTYDKNRFYEMNKKAARFFHNALFADTPDAKAALAYWIEKRGLSMATIKHFGLGYAPNDFSFVNYMKSEGYRDEELSVAFLCGKSEKGYLYPSFRNRVIIPVMDLSGHVIAFNGRVMDGGEPKYKNSSDTPVFRKGNTLFALNFAHKHCAERIILCEGAMDVIAMHAAGFPYAVATLGTAIRPEHARLLSRYTKKVILSYDSDAAGQKATDKALTLLEDVGLEVRILRLTGAKDPDEYIRNFGAEAFRSLLDDSHTKFDFNFERVLQRYNLDVPQQKIEAIDALCTVIAGVYSSVEREIYIAEGARRLGVDAKNLAADVQKKIALRRKEEKSDTAKAAREILGGYGDRVNPDFVKAPRAARLEEAVLGLLQLYPEYRTRTFAQEPLLTEEDFVTELGRRVFCFLRDTANAGEEFDSAMLDSVFSPDEVGRISGMRVGRMRLSDNGEAVFLECVKELKAAKASEEAKKAPVTFATLDALLKGKREE